MADTWLLHVWRWALNVLGVPEPEPDLYDDTLAKSEYESAWFSWEVTGGSESVAPRVRHVECELWAIRTHRKTAAERTPWFGCSDGCLCRSDLWLSKDDDFIAEVRRVLRD